MSLLMKALKQAEKRHQQATAVALEQSAGESVADALATSAPDALDAAADRAAGAADAAAAARDNARSAADQTEPGANDYAHLSLSIAEMAATTLTLEDA